MTWPSVGTGWMSPAYEPEGEPERYPIPLERTSYYDPRSIMDGELLPMGVHEFADGVVVGRAGGTTFTVWFERRYVWDEVLLDWLIFLPAGEPCSLVLDVYEDDRETIRWSAGSSPSHAAPFLCNPGQYATQEIDAAQGAAVIGTVSVTLADRFRIYGDQDSGWMTDKLGRGGIGDLSGRRARLRRFVSDLEGWVVIADGPIGAPQMDSSYAGFGFTIRDTRESERNLSMFGGGIAIRDYGATLHSGPGSNETVVWGARGPGPLGGWTGPVGPVVLPPAIALTGMVTISPNPRYSGFTRWIDFTVNHPFTDRAYLQAAREATDGVIVTSRRVQDFLFPVNDYVVSYPDLCLYWRDIGGGPWHEIAGDDLISWRNSPAGLERPVNLFEATPVSGGEEYIITQIGFWDRRRFSGAGDELPDLGTQVEVIVTYRGAPSDGVPQYLSGLTAGELARNCYSGLYAPPGLDGQPRPTGIRYDEAALLRMAEPVYLRVTESVDDLRDWLERTVYQPLGWIPALDSDGRVSPVSQVAPDSAEGLPLLDDSIAVPSASWNAGETTINVVRCTYPRYYWWFQQEQTEPGQAMRVTGVKGREITIEYQNGPSIERYGRRSIDIDMSAFPGWAVGMPAWPDDVTQSAYDDPAQEPGAVLADERERHIGNRYAFGAPAFTVAVMRSATAFLRAGSWVAIDLSWLPDYVTGRRGLKAMGQVIAIGDLDCAWRQITVEVVVPLREETS